MTAIDEQFWSIPEEELCKSLGTSAKGLSSGEAKSRILRYGMNLLAAKRRTGLFSLIISQFKSPIVLILLFILKADPAEFRCGWFTESVISAVLVVFIIRSQRPFFRSTPGKYLLITSILIIAIVLLFPFTLPGKLFGFNPLPFIFYPVLLGILILYVLSAEVAKSIFYRKTGP